MRLGDNKPDEQEPDLPLEVQLWVNRGWTVMPSERLGVVLCGPKTMAGRTKFLIVLGIVLLCLFRFGPMWPGIGVVFLVLAVVDYKYATKSPTKFFPANGEKKRTLER